MKVGTNVAVFVIFFGIAIMQALTGENWPLAGIFLILAIMSCMLIVLS